MIPARPLIITIQLILLAFLAYFAAGTVNSAVAEMLRGKPQLALAAPPQAAPAEPPKPKSAYAVITRNDIFNPPKAEPTKKPGAGPVSRLPPLKAKLVGTAPSSDGDSFAILLAEKKQQLFRVGDQIEKRTLDRVEWDHIVLRYKNKEEILKIEDPKSGRSSKGRTAKAATKSRGAGGIEKIDDNTYLVDQSEVDDAMENLNHVFTQVRAVPHFEDGKAAGFRLFAIRSGSIFERLGLKNGDIVSSVNGNELTDPVRAMALLEELKDQSDVSLDITRNREPVGLSYEVR